MKQFFRYVVMKECEGKIRLKCRFIHLIGVNDDDIKDLNEMTKQFLDLMEIWAVISHDED
ncbi:MAG: hypothetical protein K2J39_03540 [Ruminococcus sp.]|nr:hypothetical protein [Ruminococcus sp.]